MWLLYASYDEGTIDVSKQTLWKAVRCLGFRWKETNSQKTVLCEQQHLVALRCQYLREIKKMREQDIDIVFVDETYINESYTVKKEWMSSDGSIRRHVPSGKGRRLIIAHSGSASKGFIEGTQMVFESKSRDNRDYHTEMNQSSFKEYIANVLDALDQTSCIVMDNASYHNAVGDADKIPTTSWKKCDIKNWLQKENVSFPIQSLKPELLQIVKRLNKQKKYIVDQLIHEAGHYILRLPPYHSHLNPIELVWAEVKRSVAENNTTFKLKDVHALTMTTLPGITQDFGKNV